MADPSVNDLKTLADTRAADAQYLLAGGRHSAAYYLAGYAIECGLKAIIAHAFRAGVIPSKRFVDKVYTHNLVELLSLAGLKNQLDADLDQSADLRAAWSIVSSWNEGARYEQIDPFQATAMVDAVVDGRSGVMQWLKGHW